MKTLQQLLEGLPAQLRGPGNVPVSDITFDSRKVTPGAVFIALRGVHHDGHAFIPVALKAGAAAVVAQQETDTGSVPLATVSDPMRVLGPMAARLWDYPSRRLLTVGITGTNGKTTTSYLVESIFRAAEKKPGILGTINYRFGGKSVPAPNTTPFASELQRFLADIVHQGGDSCVMEVSSHALQLGRVDDVEFDVAVFTNLTQDHLDFHGTMEAYGAAKALLFAMLNRESAKTFPRCAVINLDDPFGAQIATTTKAPILSYRLHGQADLLARNLICDASGSRFELVGPKGFSVAVNCPLLGDYNVMNALAAAGVGISQGLSSDVIRRGLETVDGVPGRMERVSGKAPFTVVVDYAHSEDALRKVMGALRKLGPKRLITVFGCGGDRDRTKRPLMGQAAAELSDEIIVTSDNPRSEDPGRIALDVEVGVRRVRTENYRVILEREEAISEALRQAKTGDIVLIAGKGHENYQIVGDRYLPFDDREVARRLISKLGYA